MNLLVTGPDVWKAKSSAFIEGEFFGTSCISLLGIEVLSKGETRHVGHELLGQVLVCATEVLQ